MTANEGARRFSWMKIRPPERAILLRSPKHFHLFRAGSSPIVLEDAVSDEPRAYNCCESDDERWLAPFFKKEKGDCQNSKQIWNPDTPMVHEIDPRRRHKVGGRILAGVVKVVRNRKIKPRGEGGEEDNEE